MRDLPNIVTRYAAPLRRGLGWFQRRARLQARIDFVLEGCRRRRMEALRVAPVEMLPEPYGDGFKWRTVTFYPWPIEVGVRWAS